MDNVDLNNLSTDVRLGGKLALPVGSVEFSIKDLLDRYEADTLISVGVDDSGTLMLFVENVINYKTPDLSEKFDALVDDMMEYNVETKPLDLGGFSFPLTPGIGRIIEKDTTMTFDFNSLNANDTLQKISRILFTKTTIAVKVDTYDATYPPGFLTITIQIPGTNDSIVIDASRRSHEEKKENLEIKLNDSTYMVKFKVTGDGSTSISTDAKIKVSIDFKESEYVVYGHFYYNDGRKQMQPYHVDLFRYLPEGTDLRFYAPSFKFNVTSNIGVPFIFDMDTITSYIHDKAEPTHVKLNWMNNSNVVKASPEPGVSIVSVVGFDKETFDGQASKIFNTSLDSISATYTFRAPERGNQLAETEQFIASNSWLQMTASAQMPFWLDAGSTIVYTDTLTDVGDISNDYITNASLIFSYTSYLPMSFGVTITPLDENRQPVATSSPDNKYSYKIRAADVDEDGLVDNPIEDKFTISYDAGIIDDLKKTRHLIVKVEAEGVTPYARIKITEADGLKIRVELRAEGGITVSSDEK
jgi:hypothetical protein